MWESFEIDTIVRPLQNKTLMKIAYSKKLLNMHDVCFETEMSNINYEEKHHLYQFQSCILFIRF